MNDHKALIMKELADGIELAKQLRIRMLNATNNTNTNTNTRLREDEEALNYFLLDKILSSFDKSLSLAKLVEFDDSRECSLGGISSPYSEASSQDLRVSKKRKKMTHRIERVRVNKTVSGLEGPLNDGLTWRKYGQKDILGAKFPRSYYRCTHRYTQSCIARKQVQKLDEDTTIYQVIYKGEHTCVPGTHFTQAHKNPNKAQLEVDLKPLPQLGPGPMTDIKPIEKENEAQILRSISFSSCQIEQGLIDEYMLSSSPEFLLPLTSVTTFGQGLNVDTSEPDLNESISGPSSGINSPNVDDFEFHFGMLPDIVSNFSFDFDSISRRF